MNQDTAEIEVSHADDNLSDACKIFVSRIPTTFDDGSVKRVLEERLGDGTVVEVALVYEKEHAGAEESEAAERAKSAEESAQHRGFAFVTLDTAQRRQEAIQMGTIRGGRKPTSTKKHTMYVRPVLRAEDTNEAVSERQVCYLWSAFRCPYGNDCKFSHEGNGGCVKKEASSKRQKCFAFKKGKCKAGDNCPFSHDLGDKEVCTKQEQAHRDIPKSEKDCINWKTKGKCRKGEKCPYRHNDTIREAALGKIERKKRKRYQDEKSEKNPQPLSVRVFGLNYETTKQDIHDYFRHCGPIVEIIFPTFEDSGRSKGYCGVLFQSPKAVAKAVEMNGKELHGRWLSIQGGKMYLKQWEENRRSNQKELARKGDAESAPPVGEFFQRVKKRRRHGHKD